MLGSLSACYVSVDWTLWLLTSLCLRWSYTDDTISDADHRHSSRCFTPGTSPFWIYADMCANMRMHNNRCNVLTRLHLDKMVAILVDDIFNCIFVNENDRNPTKISLKYVPRSPIDNKPALVQVTAWRWTGKPLPGPMMTQFIDDTCHFYSDVCTRCDWWLEFEYTINKNDVEHRNTTTV